MFLLFAIAARNVPWAKFIVEMMSFVCFFVLTLSSLLLINATFINDVVSVLSLWGGTVLGLSWLWYLLYGGPVGVIFCCFRAKRREYV